MNENKKENLVCKFGKRIHFERIKRGLSQEKLAELADLHHSTISTIERGTFSATLDSVEKLSKAFEMKPHELLIFEDLKI